MYCWYRSLKKGITDIDTVSLGRYFCTLGINQGCRTKLSQQPYSCAAFSVVGPAFQSVVQGYSSYRAIWYLSSNNVCSPRISTAVLSVCLVSLKLCSPSTRYLNICVVRLPGISTFVLSVHLVSQHLCCPSTWYLNICAVRLPGISTFVLSVYLVSQHLCCPSTW